MSIEQILIERRLSKEELRQAVASCMTIDPARLGVFASADDQDSERLGIFSDCIVFCELEHVHRGDFQTLVRFESPDEHRFPELIELQRLCGMLGCRGLVDAGFRSAELSSGHLMILADGEVQAARLDSDGDLAGVRVCSDQDGIAELDYVGDDRGKLERFTDFAEKRITLPLIRRVLMTCAFAFGVLVGCFVSGTLDVPRGAYALPPVVCGAIFCLVVGWLIRARS